MMNKEYRMMKYERILLLHHSTFLVHHFLSFLPAREGFYFYGMAYRQEVWGAMGWVAMGSYDLVRPEGQGPPKEAAGRNGRCEKSWRG
jgi:hypothetical protein